MPDRQHLRVSIRTPRTPHTPRSGQYQFFFPRSFLPAPATRRQARHHHRPNFPKSSSQTTYRAPRPLPTNPPSTQQHSLNHFSPKRKSPKTLRIEPTPYFEQLEFPSSDDAPLFFFSTRISTPQIINNGRRKGKVRGRKELGRQDGGDRGPQEAAEPLGEGRSPGKNRPRRPSSSCLRRDFWFSRSLLFCRAIITYPERRHLDASGSGDHDRDPPRWPILVGASSSIALMARHSRELRPAAHHRPRRHPAIIALDASSHHAIVAYLIS